VTAVAALVLVLLSASAGAHELRPGYLELRGVDGDAVEMLWKVPARGDLRFGLRPVLPAACAVVGTTEEWTEDAHVERTRLRCPGGLVGHALAVDGLAATLTDVLVRVVDRDGAVQTARLTPSAPAYTIAASPGRLDVARTYMALGVEHILLGVDHLLFVLALVLLVRDGRRLAATVTAFTAAHSLTLAAATLGWVHVPQRPVEAVIALSIAFVAAEIVHGSAMRRPWIVAFVFGLLHGLGFAGALAEVGLPSHAVPLALFCFNVGVELGQLAFVAAVLALMAIGRRLPGVLPAWGWRLPPYAIGVLAAYWTIARTIAG
jgi:hydrogenase/urease accessory protein HupE